MRDVEDFGFTPQNNYDRAAEKGPASNDRRHQFVANVVYPLPWTMQIGLFAQARSGLPFNVTTGVDNNRDTDDQRSARPGESGWRPARWRRPTTRTSPAASAICRATSRAGRGYFEAHLRVSKMIDALAAKLDRIELFAEALNVTNHVNLGTPQGNLRSAAFGQSTAFNSDSSPRRIELGFRVDF